VVTALGEARPLRDLIDEWREPGGGIAPGRATQIGLPLLHALAVAHRLGVGHGELSVSSLFVAPPGEGDRGPALLVHGLAVPKGRAAPEREPSQRRPAPVDVQADLLAVAALLYELLLGHPPGERPSDLVASLGPRLASFLLRGLSPQDGFAGADDMARALLIAAPPPVPIMAAPQRMSLLQPILNPGRDRPTGSTGHVETPTSQIPAPLQPLAPLQKVGLTGELHQVSLLDILDAPQPAPPVETLAVSRSRPFTTGEMAAVDPAPPAPLGPPPEELWPSIEVVEPSRVSAPAPSAATPLIPLTPLLPPLMPAPLPPSARSGPPSNPTIPATPSARAPSAASAPGGEPPPAGPGQDLPVAPPPAAPPPSAASSPPLRSAPRLLLTLPSPPPSSAPAWPAPAPPPLPQRRSASPLFFVLLGALTGCLLLALMIGLIKRFRPRRPAPAPAVTVPPARPATPPPPATGLLGGPPRCPRDMVGLPGARTLIGSPDGPDALPNERPQHLVELSPFCLDRYEVRNVDYHKCERRRGCTPAGRDFGSAKRRWEFLGRNQPVVQVSHDQAAAYCRAQGKRLPTEAEWEYAAAGVAGRRYPWGDQAPTCERTLFAADPRSDRGACEVLCPGEGPAGGVLAGAPPGRSECLARCQQAGRCAPLHRPRPAPVGSFPQNATPEGIYDLAGNVAEWVADPYADQHPAGPGIQKDPVGPASGADRVVRGGGFLNPMALLRTRARDHLAPQQRDLIGVGFRCAASVRQAQALIEKGL
jgi:formylglycine-generating enzyme required for sulfatase activity